MRCARCGNNSTDDNRFCGMCGAPLVTRPSVASQAQPSVSNSTSAPPRQVAVPTPVSTPPPSTSQTVSPPDAISQAPAVASRDLPNTEPQQPSESFPPPPDTIRRPDRPEYPLITGPSFLGLSTPGPASRSHDPHSSSSNLDYLLDDEEEPKRGWGKLILIVAAVALAVGFGYLHWKQGGFDWLTASNKKPAITASDATQKVNSGTEPTPNVADKTPSPAASSEGTTPADAPLNAPNSASSQPPPQNAVPDSAAPNSNPPAPADATPPVETSADSAPSKDAAAKNPADSTTAADNSNSEPAPTAKPSPVPRARERKPPASKPVPPRPADSVAEAKRYIYGTGVTQDCDRGVRLLKSEQTNPNALISLGSLYSSGTCTPRDLPTAYRWYALALHKQPDNQVLQDNLKSLWDKMTQPERQLAIKLSQ